MRSNPWHNLRTPAGTLVTIHFSLQVRVGKFKAVFIIIVFNNEHLKDNQIFSRTQCNIMFYFSWESLYSKQTQILMFSPFNCLMLKLILSLQSRCNVHWLINFTFEPGVKNGCVATINLYEEIASASVARAFHPGTALMHAPCMHLIQHCIFTPFSSSFVLWF